MEGCISILKLTFTPYLQTYLLLCAKRCIHVQWFNPYALMDSSSSLINNFKIMSDYLNCDVDLELKNKIKQKQIGLSKLRCVLLRKPICDIVFCAMTF